MPLTEQELRENKRRQDAAYYARNKERRKLQASQWQKNNPEKVRQRNKKWRDTHREFYLESHRKSMAEYAQRHPERIKAITYKHYHTKIKPNPIAKRRAQESSKRWKKSHPEYQMQHYHRYKLTARGSAKIRAASEKRRALKKAATINLSSITDWIARIKSKSVAVCYYCDKRIPTTRIHVDHIIALANGGSHSVDNLCVACDKCNSSKGAKPIRAWIRMGQQVLEL